MVRRPVVKRVAILVASGVVCSLAAYLGAWWVPFLDGVAAGLLGMTGRFPRGGVLAAMAGAAGGWAVLLWAMALAGLPAGATAHVIAAYRRRGGPASCGSGCGSPARCGAIARAGVLLRAQRKPRSPRVRGAAQPSIPRQARLSRREIPSNRRGYRPRAAAK